MSKREIMNMDNLNDDHKEAATYVVDFLNESGQKVLAELISKRFQLKKVERYDIEKSFIKKWCEENKLHFSIQGYIEENNKEYPSVYISGDIRKWEEAIKDYVK